MLEVSSRAGGGGKDGGDALLSALLFGGLALFLPTLCSWLQASLPTSLPLAWRHLGRGELAVAAPVLRHSLRPLLIALLLPLGLCGLGWLAVWRFRAVQPGLGATGATAALSTLLACVLWLLGTTALVPRWLELTSWPTESYAAALLGCVRGLLWLCAMAAVLRTVLSLRR